MTEPPQSYSQTWGWDDRPELPQTGDERTMLTTYLDHHRMTFELTCRGVESARLNDRTMPPSTLTLHGCSGTSPEWSAGGSRSTSPATRSRRSTTPTTTPTRTSSGSTATSRRELAAWRRECARSREIVAAHDLDDEGTRVRDGEPVSLRGVLVKMIAQYARHNGHADLLREGIDGATGF